MNDQIRSPSIDFDAWHAEVGVFIQQWREEFREIDQCIARAVSSMPRTDYRRGDASPDSAPASASPVPQADARSNGSASSGFVPQSIGGTLPNFTAAIQNSNLSINSATPRATENQSIEPPSATDGTNALVADKHLEELRLQIARRIEQLHNGRGTSASPPTSEDAVKQ